MIVYQTRIFFLKVWELLLDEYSVWELQSKGNMSNRLCERICGHGGRFRTWAGASPVCLKPPGAKAGPGTGTRGGVPPKLEEWQDEHACALA